jgi:hypothetical protein
LAIVNIEEVQHVVFTAFVPPMVFLLYFDKHLRIPTGAVPGETRLKLQQED